MIQSIKTIFNKEFLDSIRDRRSYMAAFSFSLFPPLMVVLFFFLLQDKALSTKPVDIKLTGAEYAPTLVEHLKRADIIEGWDKKSQISIDIPDNFQQNINSGDTVYITVTADHSDKSTRAKLSRISNAINGFSHELGSLRLIARGINPSVVRPIQIQQKDISTPKAKAAMLMSFVVMMMIQAAFISGMNVAIDSSSGERERNSLELLLSHPISTNQIVLGKVLNASMFAAIGVTLTVLFSVLAFTYVPLYKVGLTTEISVIQAISMVLICIPLAFLASALQMFVSFQAKTFKEAQIYVTYTQFLPMILIMGHTIMEWDFVGVSFLPLLGQADALTSIIKGQSVDIAGLMLSQLLSIGIITALIILIGKMLKSEKTVFGL